VTTPLEGIRVLDFTRQMAGPYATVFLADYGADVIKVESVPNGDGSRTTGVAYVGDQSGLFLMWNRGKRSLALDMRTAEAKEAVRRLAQQADIVIENYRPGVADDIGVGYDQLSELNPGLIYVSVSAFGDGPLAPYPGTDPVVQAMSGVMSVTGEPDGGPNLVGVPMADFTGAMVASQAVLLGLLARERTGKGQKIDVSMLYSMLSSLTTRLATYWATGEEQGRHGSAHSVVCPYQAFETADGHAVAGVWGAGEGWPRFCAAVDMPELAEDERYLTNALRVEARAELTAMLAEVFVTRTTAEWQEAFNVHHALFGPVHTLSEALEHPHVVQAGLVQTVQHPTAGEIPQLGPVIFLRDTPGRIAGPPPLLGEHTREVLAELGYTDGEIDDMVAAGSAGTYESLSSGDSSQ
jgi:crotonobetainyl-CoA:carnitine CoA-transferase CaiB-like acyl-CoA transferase